jgi:hypothetical protein
MKPIILFGGLAGCVALIPSGLMLVLAADGRFGERAPGWISLPAFASIAALFAWISLASIALRGPSTIERGIFWLGLLAGASLLLPLLASIVMFYVARDFVDTDLTILPALLIALLAWVSFPAWMIAVIVGLPEKGRLTQAQPAGR